MSITGASSANSAVSAEVTPAEVTLSSTGLIPLALLVWVLQAAVLLDPGGFHIARTVGC